jgi:hypothetical protein
MQEAERGVEALEHDIQPPERGLKPELDGMYGREANSSNANDKKPLNPGIYPLSPEVLLMLMPAAVFGTLARLGLDALTTYPGESIFPLAYVQGVGCLVMGFCLGLKGPISDL